MSKKVTIEMTDNEAERVREAHRSLAEDLARQEIAGSARRDKYVEELQEDPLPEQVARLLRHQLPEETRESTPGSGGAPGWLSYTDL